MNMWNKDLLEHLIDKYKEHENLYNIRHPLHLDRVKRSNSLFKICKDLQQINQYVTEDEVKKKIRSLRTQFVRELRAIEKHKTLSDVEFEPKLWCFSQLLFLKPYCIIKCAFNTNEGNEDSEGTGEEDENASESVHEKQFSNDSSIKAQTKRRKNEEQEDLNNVVIDAFEESGNDLSVLAQGWSSQYAELSRQQKVLARKIISDVLFHGCLDNLTEGIVQEIHNIFETNAHKTYDPLNNDE